MTDNTKAVIKKVIGRVFFYLILTAGAVTMIFPYLWMLGTSFKSGQQVASTMDVYIFPRHFTFESYNRLFETIPFFRGVLNTMIIEVSVLTIGTFTTTITAFAFGKLHMPFKKPLFLFCLTGMMIPYIVVFLPQYKVYSQLNLTDTLFPLIINAALGNIGFFFFLTQYLTGISKDYFEAAKIDGAGYFTQYWRIMFPMCTPAIVVQMIFWFLNIWNDVLGPDMYLKTLEKKTLQVLVKYLDSTSGGGTLINQPLMMAAAFLSSIPILLVYVLFQKDFIKGVALGGVKG